MQSIDMLHSSILLWISVISLLLWTVRQVITLLTSPLAFPMITRWFSSSSTALISLEFNALLFADQGMNFAHEDSVCDMFPGSSTGSSHPLLLLIAIGMRLKGVAHRVPHAKDVIVLKSHDHLDQYYYMMKALLLLLLPQV